MHPEKIAVLDDRGVISLTGADARKLLQGLITNDMERLKAPGDALHAALLTPQGKILFDFFVVEIPDGFLLETLASKTVDLVKRLSLYKLRADVAIADVSPQYKVFALWSDVGHGLATTPSGTVIFPDPRNANLGWRVIVPLQSSEELTAAMSIAPLSDYTRRRIALGIPEGGRDYDYSDAYPHEANYDLLAGVSFNKGCFVGQEVVSRMQNKTVVRKRVVKVSSEKPLHSGADIMMGEVPIGKIGSVNETSALALLRLDRASEAAGKNIQLTAGAQPIAIEPDALGRYEASVAKRAASAGPIS